MNFKTLFSLIFIFFCLFFSLLLWADEGIDINEDDLFGESDLIAEVGEEELTPSMEDTLLINEGVEIGGEYTFTVNPSWRWNTANITLDEFPLADDEELDIGLETSLFFDARPDKDFRVFGKVKGAYPFTEDRVGVTELFSDFNLNDRVFFRGGKHLVSWGVGYFFSPADIVNLTPINPRDPGAEREGPISLKTNVPLGAHNFYLYKIVDDVDEPTELSLAPKVELVLGNSEIGVGAFLKKDGPQAGMITLTTSSGNFDIFGEGSLSYGAEKRFVREVDVSPEHLWGLEVIDRDEDIFLSGTLGFKYSNQDDLGYFNITLIGQYMYYGPGYENPDILKDNSQGVAFFLSQDELCLDDLTFPGRHYAASSINWDSLFDSDFSIKLFWIGNLSDGSGQVKPTITLKRSDELKFSLGVPVTYGDDGNEFTPGGSMLSVSFEVSFGSGSF